MSAIPLYGNVVTIQGGDTPQVSPDFFGPKVKISNEKPPRDWKENRFHFPTNSLDTLYIPYITSKALTKELLAQEIGKRITLRDTMPTKNWKVLPGIVRDSVVKQMLWESDNFLAEQLMLLSSSTLSDTLSFEDARDFIFEHHLSVLKNEPRWVDGSGLSRYNLFTPKSMVGVLNRLQKEADSLQLFALMPQWNVNGTLSLEEIKKSPSFIYAKSGSMSNMYNLCGYLKTKSGKLLAFSFMNNHFRRPSRDVRKDMYDILTTIHLSY